MEGGRYIASGTYGCVFTPPLLCKSGKQPSKKLVGKITMDKMAEQEVQVANRLRKIPLVKNYFLLPEPEVCELAPESKQTDPGIDECREDFRKHEDDIDLENMTQITMPFGGTKAYYQLFLDTSLHPKNFNFFKFMSHILEAGSILLLAGVCHYDIHPGNLLMDKYKTIRILDFGMSFPVSLINSITVNGRWKRLRFGFETDAGHPSIHNSEPPEITIMNATRRGQYTTQEAVKLTVLGKGIFQDMDKYLNISKETSRDKLLSFFTQSSLAKKKDFVGLWRTYWPGFDAWSFGCILMDTLQYLLMLQEFSGGEYKHRRPAVLATLRGLLEPNPRERLDCIEALALYDPGNLWLSRFGQKWLAQRKQQRQSKI